MVLFFFFYTVRLLPLASNTQLVLNTNTNKRGKKLCCFGPDNNRLLTQQGHFAVKKTKQNKSFATDNWLCQELVSGKCEDKNQSP